MVATLQDRLVKALRRAGICDIASANEFFEGTFLPDLNGRFTVPAAASADHHRAVSRELDLSRILSIQEERVVQNDWTVRWQNRIWQLPRASSEIIQPRQRVTLCEQLDGVLRVFGGSLLELSWSATRSEPPSDQRKISLGHPTGSSQGRKPRADHLWRGKHATQSVLAPDELRRGGRIGQLRYAAQSHRTFTTS